METAPAPAPVAAPTTGTPWWVPIGIVVFVGVLIGLGYLIFQHQSDAQAEARAAFEATTVAPPDGFEGLTRGAGPGVGSAQTRMDLALAEGGAVDARSAVYVDAAGSSTVVVAAARRISPPEDLVVTAESTAERFGADGGPELVLTQVQPGTLGGVMMCGTTTVSELPATYCVAVDEGSVAELLIAGIDPTRAAETARALRESSVKRTA